LLSLSNENNRSTREQTTQNDQNEQRTGAEVLQLEDLPICRP
jgi:hypothetical protein